MDTFERKRFDKTSKGEEGRGRPPRRGNKSGTILSRRLLKSHLTNNSRTYYKGLLYFCRSIDLEIAVFLQVLGVDDDFCIDRSRDALTLRRCASRTSPHLAADRQIKFSPLTPKV